MSPESKPKLHVKSNFAQISYNSWRNNLRSFEEHDCYIAFTIALVILRWGLSQNLNSKLITNDLKLCNVCNKSRSWAEPECCNPEIEYPT
jgi:hypothetical protein